jgi:tetratricopeptide (TPR) repeat protein
MQEDGPSYQELRLLGAESHDVSRGHLVDTFITNLGEVATDEGHTFLYSVYGQGGTGKSRLMDEFAVQGLRSDALVARCDETETDAFVAMRRLRSQLSSTSFQVFDDATDRYEQLFRRVRDDHEAHPEVARRIGHGAGRLGVALAPALGPAGALIAAVGQETVSGAMTEVVAYLHERFEDPADRALLADPVEALSPRFVDGLRKACLERPVALVFDGFERTQSFAEPWLLRMFGGDFGPTPSAMVVLVSGQKPLSRLDWADHLDGMSYVELDVFSRDEATQLIHASGVTQAEVVEAILRLSGRLPLLVAMLASQHPVSESDLVDPSADAVEVFLRLIHNPLQREIAINASVARRLNRDVLCVVLGEHEITNEFEWLTDQPFVQERLSDWTYHQVVRSHMSRHLRKTSSSEWIRRHSDLAAYYTKLQAEMERGDALPVGSSTWQDLEVERLYHILAAHPEMLSLAIESVATAVQFDKAFALRLTNAVNDVALETSEQDFALAAGHLAGVCSDDAELRESCISELLERKLVKADSHLLRLRAVSRSDRGSLKEAFADFELLEAQSPDRFSALDLAVCSQRAGQAQDALTYADLALERVSDNDEEFRRSVQRVRSRCLAAVGKFDEANRLVDGFVAALPGDKAALLCQAEVREQSDDFQGAIGSHWQVIEIDPAYRHSGLQSIGRIYAAAGALQDAHAAIVESLRLEPACGHCWSVLADIAVAQGPAEDLLDRLNDVEIDFCIAPRARYWRAQALGDHGRYGEALEELESAFALDPELRGAFAVRQALWLLWVGRYRDAARSFRRALEADPDNAALAYDLAVASVLSTGLAPAVDDLARARQLLRRAESLGNTVDSNYGLAGLAALAGSRDEAIRHLELAAEADASRVAHNAINDPAWTSLRDDGEVASLLQLRSAT